MSDFDNNNLVSEPIAEYITSFSNSIQLTLAFFGGLAALNLNDKIASDFDLMRLTRRGIPKNAMLNFVKKISITLQEFSNIMHISDRTFQRFDDTTLIKSEYSEKALELARLYAHGEEVFGSLDKFKIWVKMPSHVFKNETPFSLLDTSIGFDLVKKELGRIQHGIFS
ncbi:DUF2384 domain-containing protein [Pedobacter sp. SD-b]|uniref:DUF2384 domain-containing protein n=1 Tax=Pedobacter segetis TaxID=2793069 RepID=A0ABS1BJC8_9SPHI|nr:antitoxin Xre/MbcA/ParS toxin-binding domain-containing protein [Pedobacter segetis]MBK0382965.1 DUF2384 domain-containing protein [Pedobacter segetis]